MYIRFLFHCYIDTEVDNKEVFVKKHIWELFNSFLTDILKVTLLVSCDSHVTVNWLHSDLVIVM